MVSFDIAPVPNAWRVCFLPVVLYANQRNSHTNGHRASHSVRHDFQSARQPLSNHTPRGNLCQRIYVHVDAAAESVNRERIKGSVGKRSTSLDTISSEPNQLDEVSQFTTLAKI